ncbi:tyrosine-type recombinase/integrase [Sinomonas sp. JGH33]|uniref:Tyrosine-type recombinase/integrase n=1 Tax=Sinomonas terricola TaxID=3110330 RepID=A0ABU5T1Q9_9MICC|nr:tyrosine-type recombinase/integrase [Sinomonas sp. JGH33]MEA5453594.1 tyrosine-type recombinase/integrase [Sinomonas sp. JGH33]
MSDITRRCGCRDEEGRQYTAGRKCPKLKDPRHGSWGYRVSAGTMADPKPGAPGHRKRRYLTGSGFDRKKDAEEALDKALRAYRGQGEKFFDRTTVSDYMGDWLGRLERDGDHKPSTLRMYRSYAERHIMPDLGEKRLIKVTRNDVAVFIDGLRAKHLMDPKLGVPVKGPDGKPKPLGAVTIRRVVATLSSALGDAKKRGLIEANPAEDQELPTAAKKPLTVWEKHDAARFLDGVAGHRLGALYRLVIFTGLRRGEVCGLKWEDIDLVAGRLTVRRNRVQVGPDVVEGEPKTEKGNRVVMLDPSLVTLLAGWANRQDAERKAWGEAYTETGRVFTYEDGRDLRPEYVSKLLDTVIAGLKPLPRLRFHDLRHQFASILNDLGEDIVTISKLMGHANTAITSDLYTHAFEDKARRVSVAASSWLAPAEEPA